MMGKRPYVTFTVDLLTSKLFCELQVTWQPSLPEHFVFELRTCRWTDLE